MPTPAELAVDKRIANIEINDTLSNISAYRQREWLLRSQLWLNLPQAEWMGGKVLGKGSCGIVGRFDYQGKNPKVPRSIAIKQTAAERSRHALSRESKFLRILTATENPHIVKLYKGYHQVSPRASYHVFSLFKLPLLPDHVCAPDYILNLYRKVAVAP